MNTTIELVQPAQTMVPADPARLTFLRTNGYLLIPNALTPEQLAVLRERFDDIVGGTAAATLARDPNTRMVEVMPLIERDPAFAELMDWPTTFPYVRAVIGRDVTLTAGGGGYWQPPGVEAFISWHNDFQWMVDVPYPRQNHWIRCTYFLDDITEERGAIGLLPGSHLADHECPTAELTDERGQPRVLPGQVNAVGPAGTCMINNTEIWHTNRPNRSDRPRKVIMLTYKHAWMRTWGDGADITPSFMRAQVTPLRRQLCGEGGWHRFDRRWDA